MTDELQEKCDDILEYEFRAHEMIDDVINNYGKDNVESCMLNSVEELLSKVEDPERVMACYVLAYQLGRAIESEMLIEYANEGVEQFKRGR
jgi:hypothetical protein